MSERKLAAYLLSEEFGVSKMTSTKRLQIAFKLLVVQKEAVNKFGARKTSVSSASTVRVLEWSVSWVECAPLVSIPGVPQSFS